MNSRVLIVDDNAETIEAIERYLARESVDFRGVTDSRLAEQTFYTFEPDLVFLDLIMPDPDGFEILRRLAPVRSRLGFLPLIVLTGDHGKQARDTALVLGANDYLTKPLDSTEVLLRARNLLRMRQLYVDLLKANEALEGRLSL
jgi:putative two-component system response regulator